MYLFTFNIYSFFFILVIYGLPNPKQVSMEIFLIYAIVIFYCMKLNNELHAYLTKKYYTKCSATKISAS